jgi:hypothetical protein
MVASMWRLRRLWGIETGLFDAQMDSQEKEIEADYETISEPIRLALAFRKLTDDSHSLAMLTRYESRLRRAYNTALQDLIALQQLRAGVAEAPPEPAVSLPSSDSLLRLPEPVPHA